MKRLMILAAMGSLLTAPALADELTVTKDESKVIKLTAPASTVVVGNPEIADVTMQDGSTAFVTGKGFGSTNVIAMDDHGRQIATFRVVVTPSANRTVTLLRGNLLTTLSCAPRCEVVATAAAPASPATPAAMPSLAPPPTN